MKLNKFFSVLTLIAAVAFTACDNNIPDGPQGPQGGKDTTKVDPPQPNDDTLTVASIIEMKSNGTLADKGAGTQKYWVKGYIVGTYNFDANPQWVIGTDNAVNSNLLIADDPESTDTYAVATVKLAQGTFRNLLNLVDNPDNYKKRIKLYGVVEKYCGVGGVVNIEKVFLDGEELSDNTVVGEIDYEDGEMSVTDFLALDAIKNLAAGATTTEEYIVRGIVKSVSSVALSYGNAQFYITDGTSDLLCYNIYGLNGEKFVNAKQLEVGDIVTVKSVVTNYNGTIEPKGGYITRTTNTFDPSTVSGPQEATIAEILALNLAEGVTSDGQYKVTGSISEVTDASTAYGNLTFTITDETDASLICYRVYYLDNKKYTESDPTLNTGDVVEVIGQVKNHYGKIEIVNGYVSQHIQ